MGAQATHLRPFLFAFIPVYLRGSGTLLQVSGSVNGKSHQAKEERDVYH
jgi:hypothetical protein